MFGDFEFDDKVVLKLSSVAAGAYAVHSLAAPDHFHDTYYESTVARNPTSLRWFGTGLASAGASTLMVSISDDSDNAPKTVKNLLKATGVAWSFAAAESMYNVEVAKTTKKDIGYATAAGQALIAALCLWRGFKEEDKA